MPKRWIHLQAKGGNVRELEGAELMVVRVALHRESEEISKAIKEATDPVGLRAYRKRLEKIGRLQETFANGCRILGPFEDPNRLKRGDRQSEEALENCYKLHRGYDGCSVQRRGVR